MKIFQKIQYGRRYIHIIKLNFSIIDLIRSKNMTLRPPGTTIDLEYS